MSERDVKPQPKRSARGAAEAEARQARLAAALKENLKKRKAQKRSRKGEGTHGNDDEPA